MAETHDTIDGLLAEFRGYSAGMPDSYHVTMSWADFRKMLDRFDTAHKRERGNAAKLREAISTLRTALKEIRNDVLDMVMNHKSEDPDSYAHGLCLSIGGACDMALNSTKEFDNADK